MTTLHAFISGHRAELFSRCIRKLKEESPSRSVDELADNLSSFVDEVIRALRHDAGLCDTSPLPSGSATASGIGERRQLNGYPITQVARTFSVVCDSVGALGDLYQEIFTSREYRVFNLCLDAGIASAIDRYFDCAQSKQRSAAAEKIGFLAHELRNRAMSCRLAYTILKRGDVGIDSKTGDVLGRNLIRLEELLNLSLVAAQVDARMPPEFRTIHLAALFRELAAGVFPERGIAVVVDVDESLAIEADERIVVSAIVNLLQNAIKFTRDCGRVVLRARPNGDRVVMEVEDECGGLPPGRAEDLFVPFVQVGTDPRGVGLGLPITRDAVRAHGGEVGVRDLPGKGCVFTVCLPRESPFSRRSPTPSKSPSFAGDPSAHASFANVAHVGERTRT